MIMCQRTLIFDVHYHIIPYAHFHNAASPGCPSPGVTQRSGGFALAVPEGILPCSSHKASRALQHPVLQREYKTDCLNQSQNHRTVGVGRDLCGSPGPTPPAQAGSPRAGCTAPRPGGSFCPGAPSPCSSSAASSPLSKHPRGLPSLCLCGRNT